MKLFTRILPVLMLLWSTSVLQAELDSDSIQHLGEDQILLLDAESNKAGGFARVRALMHASAQSVWNVIVSCEQSFLFVDGLKACEVIEDSDGHVLVHQVVKKGWYAPKQDFVFESRREPYRSIRFELVEGNLKEMEGSWRFTETPEGLLVDYQIRIRPGLPVPGFIVSSVMRKGMPDLIACIRGLAGGSGSRDRENSDLGRCRGKAAEAG